LAGCRCWEALVITLLVARGLRLTHSH